MDHQAHTQLSYRVSKKIVLPVKVLGYMYDDKAVTLTPIHISACS